MKPEFFYRVSLVGEYIGMDLPMTFDTSDEAIEFATDIFGKEKRMTVIEYRNGIPNRVYFSHNDILDEVGEGWVETKEYVEECVGEVMTA